jgi:hypothetical protein
VIYEVQKSEQTGTGFRSDAAGDFGEAGSIVRREGQQIDSGGARLNSTAPAVAFADSHHVSKPRVGHRAA